MSTYLVTSDDLRKVYKYKDELLSHHKKNVTANIKDSFFMNKHSSVNVVLSRLGLPLNERELVEYEKKS